MPSAPPFALPPDSPSLSLSLWVAQPGGLCRSYWPQPWWSCRTRGSSCCCPILSCKHYKSISVSHWIITNTCMLQSFIHKWPYSIFLKWCFMEFFSPLIIDLSTIFWYNVMVGIPLRCSESSCCFKCFKCDLSDFISESLTLGFH